MATRVVIDREYETYLITRLLFSSSQSSTAKFPTRFLIILCVRNQLLRNIKVIDF